jgi:Zinc-finger domain
VPHHPHIYIDMRDTETTLCPYCATRFRFALGERGRDYYRINLARFRSLSGLAVEVQSR